MVGKGDANIRDVVQYKKKGKAICPKYSVF